jgi:hypothetical protein
MLARLDQASLDLLAAADYLEEHGWCQHVGKVGDRRCAVMAIREVCGNGRSHAMLKLLLHIRAPNVSDWNDTAPNAQYVIDTMRAAAYG